MTPPLTMLRADPSWDTIDLALPQSATAARAALRHAKKRYEDVLQQLQELVEYEEKRATKNNSTSRTNRGAATASHQTTKTISSSSVSTTIVNNNADSSLRQQQRISDSVSAVTATSPARSSVTASPAQNNKNQQRNMNNGNDDDDESNDFSVDDDNFTPTPQRLRRDHKDSIHDNNNNSTSKISQQKVVTDHRIVFTSTFNPIPRNVGRNTNSLTCEIISPRDLNPRPTSRLRCGTASFVSQEYFEEQEKRQEQTKFSDIDNRVVHVDRSVSSQRLGSIDHYYFHGLPSERQNQNLENEKEDAKIQQPSISPSRLQSNNKNDANPTSPTPRNPSGAKRVQIETSPQETKEDYYDECEEQQQFDKPVRTDSSSPLSFQRRPLHHHHRSNNRRNNIRIPPRNTTVSKGDLFVNPSCSSSPQRGFSLKNIGSSSPSRGNRKKQETTGSNNNFAEKCEEHKQGTGVISKKQESSFKSATSCSVSAASSMDYCYDTFVVFGLASVLVTAALKFKIVEI